MIYSQELWLLLRGFPYPGIKQESNDLECEVITDRPSSHSLLVRHDGKETVTTPAGTFPCYRLRMVPDLGILTWLGEIVAPAIHIWFMIEPPHCWVRYAGPESGPGSPRVVIELTDSECN